MKRKNVFLEALDYVAESRKFVYFAIGLFILSAFVALVIPERFGFFDETLRDLFGKTQGKNAFELVVFIFGNNVMSSFVALFSGLALGIIPFFNALTNGALVGYVLSRSIEVSGYGVIWRLVPHGIFELPAIFIAIGLGMKFGMFVFHKNKKKEFLRRGKASFNVFLYIIVPLLIVAAIIEGLLVAYY